MAAIRAAASSMPSGSPSRVAQIRITASAVCSSKIPNPGRTARARSTNRVTASDVTPSTASGDTVRSASPGVAQVLPRGREDAGDVGAGQDLTDRPRGRREHVLAVVDHDQHATSGQCLGHRVDDASTALRGDAQGGGDRVGHRVGVAHGRQLDQPHAVRELLGELRTDRQGEPCLPDAAHPGQGHQRPGADQRGHLGQDSRAPDEGGRGARQVPAAGLRAHRVSLASTSRGRVAATSVESANRRGRCPDGSPDAPGARRGPAGPGDPRARRGGDGRRSPTARRGRSAAWPAMP